MKVAIELMEMDSDAGYVPSYGHTRAILVDDAKVLGICGDAEALFELQGQCITEDMLLAVEKYSMHPGALNYHFTTGIFNAPRGKSVVVQTYENVCTSRNGIERRGELVRSHSLATLAQSRAEHYIEMARNMD